MSGLHYKADWDEAKQRHAAWWRREPMDRPLMNVRAPRDRALPAPDSPGPPSTPEARWLDAEAVLARAEIEHAKTAYLGEAFPQVCASLGPGALGTFLGAVPRLDSSTVWYEPCFDDISEAEVRFNRMGRWWQWTLRTTQLAAARMAGKSLVGVPDLIENLDTLAAMLGNAKLLLYLVDAPHHVHRLQRDLVDAWFEAFDALYGVVKDEIGGNSFIAFQVWGPGKTAKLQCDFSAMIGPGMFREFVVPYLADQCDRLDFSVYHLDGRDAIRHLGALVGIGSLDAIQWTPGAGQADAGAECWDPIYRRVLDAGKGIHAAMPIGKVRPFIQRFGKRGVYIHTSASSEREGRQLLEDATRW